MPAKILERPKHKTAAATPPLSVRSLCQRYSVERGFCFAPFWLLARAVANWSQGQGSQRANGEEADRVKSPV